LNRIGAPRLCTEVVRPLVENHLWHHSTQELPAANVVRRLAQRLAPATIADLCLVLRADHLGRPPLVKPETETRIGHLETVARELALADAAPRPIILGRHLIRLGQQPGPRFKSLLSACFEAQLEGRFTDEAGGIVHLKSLLAQPESSGHNTI
jgi:tRNA nucleotidyltransferase (CCA-adding enzyme)